MRRVLNIVAWVIALLMVCAVGSAQVGRIPDGFTSLFNGRDITGWHWSRTVHHGTTGEAFVEGGALMLRQRPFGQGGLLLTDRDYTDFEFYVEVRPDPGLNSGIFMRSTEGGAAYQLELVAPGNVGDFIGERIFIGMPEYIGERIDVAKVWKDGEWNSMRMRMVGEKPHVTLWINDIRMWELQMPKNDLPAGLNAGKIGLQLHWTATYDEIGGGAGGSRSWQVLRFRNMAVKELQPATSPAHGVTAGAQSVRTSTNTIGMEFVRINPGTMTVGKFHPPYLQPGGNAPGGNLYGEIMLAGDADGDLRLTREEMRRVAEVWFDRVDAQRAGQVTREQFTQGFAAMQPQARGGFGPPGRGGIGAGVTPAIFSVADANRDGAVSRVEFVSTLTAWFDAWDTKRTGFVTSNQVLKGLGAALALAMPPPGPGRGGPPPTAEEYARIEAAAKRDWLPGFQVTIRRPYEIGKYEVTQGQWKRVMGDNPSVYQGSPEQNDTDDYPVENVTWQDTQEFIRRLNALEQTRVYRLPTEFEWEYAARAGAEDDITWHDIRQTAFIGGNLQPQPVGRMKANAWGLYDTLGNVWEWVEDFYNEKMFADPMPLRTGTQHVLKGGGFIADVKNATYMTHAGGPGSKFDNGFRLVRETP